MTQASAAQSTQYTDLASQRIGGQTLSCSDDFFAEMENLLKPGRGVFIEDKYTDRGKWMDGWESRRRRFLSDGSSDDGLDHDWCIIKLGAQGRIRKINVDTNHFLGNAPQSIAIEVARIEGEPNDDTPWHTLVEQSPVQPGQENFFTVSNDEVWTHVKLHMYPDGGIARLRVYGEVVANPAQFAEGELIDLAYIKNGARPLVCSDMFFSHMENLIMPGRGANMGDGWETKRRRPIGDPDVDRDCDWLVLQLAAPGTISKVLIDTCHFKGNYPHRFSLQGINLPDNQARDIELLRRDSEHFALSTKADDFDALAWHTLLNETRLYADREHSYLKELQPHPEITHVRLNIYPDGGVSRLRLWGQAAR